MVQLNWNAPGEKNYEAGVDRGVLYVNKIGFAWHGLIAVEESPSGGGPRPFYQDGIKYLLLSEAEEYEATIKAYASPPEFGPCDGMAAVRIGLFATQQRRKPFGLSYRTKVGNDVGENNYKLHLVYNAVAAPSSKSNTTISDSTTPVEYSWPISTLPEMIPGIRATAHLILDSRYILPATMQTIENILYGDAGAMSRLPDPSELVLLLPN